METKPYTNGGTLKYKQKDDPVNKLQSFEDGKAPQENQIPIKIRSRPPTNSFHIICLRITLVFCITGATVGFCLLIAGGIGRHIEELKMLMYVGIMIFLVSVTLLVIMCSTWGTGGIYHMVQRPPEHYFVPVHPPREHMIYSLPNKYMGVQGYPTTFKYPYPVPPINLPSKQGYERENPPSLVKTEETKQCYVKNCACQDRLEWCGPSIPTPVEINRQNSLPYSKGQLYNSPNQNYYGETSGTYPHYNANGSCNQNFFRQMQNTDILYPWDIPSGVEADTCNENTDTSKPDLSLSRAEAESQRTQQKGMTTFNPQKNDESSML